MTSRAWQAVSETTSGDRKGTVTDGAKPCSSDQSLTARTTMIGDSGDWNNLKNKLSIKVLKDENLNPTCLQHMHMKLNFVTK